MDENFQKMFKELNKINSRLNNVENKLEVHDQNLQNKMKK